MLIDFNEIQEVTVKAMNGGAGEVVAKMYADEGVRIISCRLAAGASIGLHAQESGDDINYVLSGEGVAICDGNEEILTRGRCHICRQGSEHSIVNTGKDDLVLLTVVVKK